ncbi:MAG TPA: (Fe-S)-binding protein [Chloroflexota bacterium]|nr:(Fe-S)-binding protein [Chloroflexota bacterium]
MLRCIRCAACLTSCPTYVLTQKEEEGPRGRIAIMRAVVEGHLDITPDALQHLDSCLLCDACSHVCPSGVEMERLGVAFREVASDQRPRRPPLAERAAMGWVFGDLGNFRSVAGLLRFYQRSGLQWLARHLGLLGLLRLRDMERFLPRLPGRFVVPRGQIQGAGDRAEVFAGCIMSTAFADTTEQTCGVLAAFGCETRLTQGQVCCGALQLHAGEAERARELARRNIAAFGEGSGPIVTNAAGCGAMLKHYGQLLPEDPAAATFSARVKDVSELLAARQPTRPPREVKAKVVLQDACHLLHAQRVDEAPRRLLRAIPGLELLDLPERDICCGSAGIYNLLHPETGEALRARKCSNILGTGAELVVTGNPGCLLQLRSGLPEAVQVRHIVDILAEAYLPPSSSA